MVLVESPLTPVPSVEQAASRSKPKAAVPAAAPASKRFGHSDTVQQPGKVCGSMTSSVPREFTHFDAAKAEEARQKAEEARQQAEARAAANEDAMSSQALGSAYGSTLRSGPVDVHELD
eukprot:4070546-Prymnesium_polylepis.1